MDRGIIGARLLELRGATPQKEVADALGITQAALSMYERGVRIPKDDIKIKIAAYFNVSVQSIFYAIEVHE